MKIVVGGLLGALLLIGCDAKVGANAGMPDVAVYPGAKVVSNGENQGIIGANLMVPNATVDTVTQFYSKELSATPQAGAIRGTKNGHAVTVIVTNAGPGSVAVAITEVK